MNRCLIYEVYKGDSFGVNINESQVGVPEGMMRVTGVAAVIGVKNRNGRIYNKENYLHHIQLLQDDIAYGLYGELEHPQGFTVDLNNVSHKIEKVWFDPTTNQVMITLLLLDTPKGKIAQSIIKSGGSIRVSSRAMGNVNKDHEAIITKLVTYDIVGTPGFRETDVRLSESVKDAVPIHESSLCESFYIPVNDMMLNECMRTRYDGDITQIINNHINHLSMKKNNNLALLESALQQATPPAGGQKSVTDIMSNWVLESLVPIFEEWVTEEVIPMYESYRSRKKINESLGKSACSFGAFYKMNAAEAIRKLNESIQPLNGTIVLSEEEQEVLNKVQQGQQLTEQEKQIAQQAQQKLEQQQQQIKEALAPQNGTIVLSEEEQACLEKLQQGQQLTQEEMQQAQQALVKQQQQIAQQQQVNEGQGQGQQQQVRLTQEEQYCLQKFCQGQQLTQRQQQICQQAQQKLQQQQEALAQQQQQRKQGQQQMSQEEKQQKQQELRESLNEKNNQLTAAYRRLVEAEDPAEQEKVNQEIDQLKQECDDVKQQIEDLVEGQSQQFKQAQQKIQQGEELTQDDLDGLTQDELQQLVQQQKQQNESASDYDDPNDAKVFEQAQLTQEEQDVVRKQQKGEQLTQEEQQILKQAQEKIQQQELPSDDKQVNESLVAKYGADYLRKSGSLLESLQKRMGMALDGKN